MTPRRPAPPGCRAPRPRTRRTRPGWPPPGRRPRRRPRPGFGAGRRWRRSGRSPNALASFGRVRVGQHDGRGLRRLGRGQGLLGGGVPAADLDLLDLLGRGDDGPETQQIGAQLEHQGVLALGAARSRRAGRRGGRAEAELPLADGDLEAHVGRQSLHQLPVAGAGLGDVLVDRGGAGDVAGAEPGALRDLEGDVGGGHLRVGLGTAAPEQPVRRVVPAEHGERAARVELGLQGRDLTRHQREGCLAVAGRHRDLHRRSDLRPRLREHEVGRVAEPQLEEVGVLLAVVDEGGGEQRRDVRRQGVPSISTRNVLVNDMVTAPPVRAAGAGCPARSGAGRRSR